MNLKQNLINNKNVYLTETLLYDYIKYIFKDYEIIHNKIVPNSNIKNRPDFRIESIKLIIEFDGYRHYNDSKVIVKDLETTQIWNDLGYNIIRIPYYLQMNIEVLSLLYSYINKEVDTDNISNYKNGFIDKKALRPKDFPLLGLKRFMLDYNKLSAITQNEILNTLDDIDKHILKTFLDKIWDK